MCRLNIFMNQNKTDTIINSVEDVLKAFQNKRVEIEISENINPPFL